MIYTVLRSIFRAAAHDRMISASPCVRIALPAVAPKELEVPDVVMVRRLWEELPERYRAVVLVAAGLGLRPGEVFGLEVADVDFLRRRVRVARQLDQHGVVAPLKRPARTAQCRYPRSSPTSWPDTWAPLASATGCCSSPRTARR